MCFFSKFALWYNFKKGNEDQKSKLSKQVRDQQCKETS